MQHSATAVSNATTGTSKPSPIGSGASYGPIGSSSFAPGAPFTSTTGGTASAAQPQSKPMKFRMKTKLPISILISRIFCSICNVAVATCIDPKLFTCYCTDSIYDRYSVKDEQILKKSSRTCFNIFP